MQRATLWVVGRVRLMLFVIAMISIVVGLIVYLMVMKSTPQEQKDLNSWPKSQALLSPN